MVTWKIWHDVRHRFYGSIFFILAIAILHVGLFPFMRTVVNWAEVDIKEWPDVRFLVENYVTYTDLRWFQEIERNALFGIILALGGVLTEARQKTILLTLSLPVPRRMWILVQFFLVLALLFILNVVALPILIAGGVVLKQPLGILHTLGGMFLVTITAAPYIAVTLLFTSITGDSLKACLYSIAFLIFSNRLDSFLAIDPWMPESLTRFISQAGFPWQAMMTILFVSIAALAAAIVRFQKTDY